MQVESETCHPSSSLEILRFFVYLFITLPPVPRRIYKRHFKKIYLQDESEIVTQALVLLSLLLKRSSVSVCFSLPAGNSQQLTSQLILKGAPTCEFLLVLSRTSLLSEVLVDY